jgi:hypothetical protein
MSTECCQPLAKSSHKDSEFYFCSVHSWGIPKMAKMGIFHGDSLHSNGISIPLSLFVALFLSKPFPAFTIWPHIFSIVHWSRAEPPLKRPNWPLKHKDQLGEQQQLFAEEVKAEQEQKEFCFVKNLTNTRVRAFYSFFSLFPFPCILYALAIGHIWCELLNYREFLLPIIDASNRTELS